MRLAGNAASVATPAILTPRLSRSEAAVGWGVQLRLDHLFCAMSDRARLRQTQAFPMRGGLMEATLYFDELTTEVIADGKHLTRELLLLAYKIKGPDRLALVTDSNRALDMPDGEYVFGPLDGGEPILRGDGVGLMPDGRAAWPPGSWAWTIAFRTPSGSQDGGRRCPKSSAWRA